MCGKKIRPLKNEAFTDVHAGTPQDWFLRKIDEIQE
jgi:hypothetical protein